MATSTNATSRSNLKRKSVDTTSRRSKRGFDAVETNNKIEEDSPNRNSRKYYT